MITELLKAKKISEQEHQLYMLFQANELGRKVLDRMMLDTFMDEPLSTEFGGTGFAFYDGRRSVFRDIHRVLIHVEQIIKEANNGTDPKSEPTTRKTVRRKV